MTQTTWIIAEVFVGIALLSVLMAFLTRWFSPPAPRDPEDILRERYARGEISRAEYQQMADDLGVLVRQTGERPGATDDRDIGRSSTSGHAY